MQEPLSNQRLRSELTGWAAVFGIIGAIATFLSVQGTYSGLIFPLICAGFSFWSVMKVAKSLLFWRYKVPRDRP